MRATRDKNYMVLIEDDGIGIPEQVNDGGPGEHLGLQILQERAARIGGDLKIESEAGEGTRIILNFEQPQEDSEIGDTLEVEFPAQTANPPS
jgi:two-component system nitrate/nitrite sensor histidine kinase NarX